MESVENAIDGLSIQRLGIFQNSYLGPEATRDREPMYDRRGKAVDGLNTQACRLFLEPPTKRGASGLDCSDALVVRSNGAHDAITHLGRGLARKRDRQNFLGSIHDREQVQKTLDE